MYIYIYTYNRILFIYYSIYIYIYIILYTIIYSRVGGFGSASAARGASTSEAAGGYDRIG